MRLLNTRTGEFAWVEHPHRLRYAALSHVWSKDPQCETSYHDLIRCQDEVRSARARGEILPEGAVLYSASHKVRGACTLARADGIDWLWADTCCIDKASSAELEGAINAMYSWYRSSTVCYVFLQDVDAHEDPYAPSSGFRRSEWHARGWTLQELIAPQVVLFFSRSWCFIGAKHGLASLIADVTRVDKDVITGYQPVDAVSVARRMFWASRRVTTKREDEAYCLMGIFGVHLPVVYGEDSMAFLRLQEEILKRIPDESIFAWDRALYPRSASQDPCHGGSSENAHHALFASSPSLFSASADVVFLSKHRLSASLGVPIPPPTYTFTSHGLRTTLPLLPLAQDVFAVVLACQRNDSLLGLVIKATPMSDVYSLGVLDPSSDLIQAGDLRCIVQLPTQLIDNITFSTSLKPAICVRDLSIVSPSWAHSSKEAALLRSPANPLPSHVLGLSERSLRRLASVGYRSFLSAPTGPVTTVTLSCFDMTPVANVELRRCGCPNMLERSTLLAVRATTVCCQSTAVDNLDASYELGELPGHCTLGREWHHLEVSSALSLTFDGTSSPSLSISLPLGHSSNSIPIAFSVPVRTAHKLYTLPCSEFAPDKRRPRELILTLACDYPGDDGYPARFTLSIDASPSGEGMSVDTGESTSTLTCGDAWAPPSPGTLADDDGEVDPPQRANVRGGDPSNHEDRKVAQAKRIEACARMPLGSLLWTVSRGALRGPARLWAAVKRHSICQKDRWSCRTPSVYGSEGKRDREVCKSVPRIVVHEATSVSARQSSSTLPSV